MQFNEYQKEASSFALASARMDAYLFPGLVGEVGELCSLYAKGIRDGQSDPSQFPKELGDILWFVALLAESRGYTLEYIAKTNIEKLASRKARNTIGGSGDDR
jgi:NTP pyrophosphatase (non-canonical NTP hydrolase)